MRVALILSLVLLASCASQGDLSGDHLPRDVQAFIDRRELCDHFRGEIPDPDEVDRMKEVVKDIDRYCTSIDKDLNDLKGKYVRNSVIMSRLNSYEFPIEATMR